MPDSSAIDGFPRVFTAGSPYERGRMYGEQARAEIQRSITGYAAVYLQARGWTWDQAVHRAAGYAPAIEEFHPSSLEEMRGIAAGAGVDVGDILALNTRSELMFCGTPDGLPGQRPGCAECTSFAAVPELTASSNTVLAQNWDWLAFARTSTVLLEARRDDLPDYVTMVEAGLLAKTGHNSAGVGMCTNTLVSTDDINTTGVPYHIVLHAILDADTISAATATVMGAPKALSANYLIGHSDGLAINLETTSGGPEAVRTTLPDRGFVAHTNHFLHPDFQSKDARLLNGPNTLFRLYSIESRLRELAGDRRPRETSDFFSLLVDHRNNPSGVCSHGNPNDHELERYVTVASVIYELTSLSMYVAAGNPCTTPYVLVADSGRLHTTTRPRVAS